MKCFFTFLIVVCSLISGCDKQKKTEDTITFATTADYPPFEYLSNGEFVGFDIELAKMIGKELGKKVQFKDMQFSAILQSIENESVDAAISTIAITDKRKINYDFVKYFEDSISIVFKKNKEIKTKEDMRYKKIACQLGTTMQIWLEKNIKDAEQVLIDNNNQAIESLKAGQVDGVIIDTNQAIEFCKNNDSLGNGFIANGDGYGIVFKKGSKMYEPVKKAMEDIRKRGELDSLQKIWMKNE